MYALKKKKAIFLYLMENKKNFKSAGYGRICTCYLKLINDYLFLQYIWTPVRTK